jgi:hypothetical protein
LSDPKRVLWLLCKSANSVNIVCKVCEHHAAHHLHQGTALSGYAGFRPKIGRAIDLYQHGLLLFFVKEHNVTKAITGIGIFA